MEDSKDNSSVGAEPEESHRNGIEELKELKTESKPVADEKKIQNLIENADNVVSKSETGILGETKTDTILEADNKTDGLSDHETETLPKIKSEETLSDSQSETKPVVLKRERSVSPTTETDSSSKAQEKLPKQETRKKKNASDVASIKLENKSPNRESLHKDSTEESTPSREKRDRKKVDRFVLETKKEEVEVEGRGIPLNDIPFIKAMIAKTTPDNLKILHRLAYGRPGAANEVKKNLYKFCGFPFKSDDKAFERKKSSVEKIVMSELKRILAIIGLERSGVKMELVERVLNFLMEPFDAGKSLPQKRKKRRSSKGVGKATSTKKGKKGESDSEEKSGSEDDGEEEEEEAEEDDDDSDEEEKAEVVAKKKEAKKKQAKPAKQRQSQGAAKKTPKAKRKRDSDSEDEDDSDHLPLKQKQKPVKKTKKVPTDTEIKTFIKDLLDKADLEEVTMKKLCQQVYDNYPGQDLSHKKDFIKSTVKSILS